MARILVIEDDVASLELIVYLLDAYGHTTLTATDGASGLALALGEHFDLILCDVQLPSADGYTIARQLKSAPERRHVPLIAVTAFAMVGDREQIMAAGFDAYVSKPFTPQTLIEQIDTLLPAARRAMLLAPTLPGAAPDRLEMAGPARTTILVVDDTPLNHELMRTILEGSGYAMVGAFSVGEALALARERHPDLIVTDLHMPGENGFDLLRALKADPALRLIKVVIHSATLRSESDRREALRLGAAAVIARPLEPLLVLAEIRACLPAPGS